MSADVQRLLDAVPIESYVQKYVQLKRKGSNYWGLCPFHKEKTPSFSVAPDKGIFKCFGCGKGGNLISFIMEHDRLGFREALQVLSEVSGIPLESRAPRADAARLSRRDELLKLNGWVKDLYRAALPGSEAEVYLKSRGISEESIAGFGIGYAPEQYRFLENHLREEGKKYALSEQQVLAKVEDLKELGLLGVSSENQEVYNRFRGRLMFPISDMKGKVCAFGGRILRDRENTGKYVNSPESQLFSKKHSLYRLYEHKEAIRSENMAILVEGYFDVMGLHAAGFTTAVAPLGTAFTPEQAKLLKRYCDRVLIFLDGDRAGVEASYKSALVARAASLQVKVVSGRENKDPFDLSRELDQLDLATLLDSARDEVAFFCWYFFVHKHNTGVHEEKRKAIHEFFEFLRGVKEQWEQNEYLKKAAPLLGSEERTLQADLARFLRGGKLAEPAAKKEEQAGKPRRQASPADKEVLAILLSHNELWEQESLLAQMKWTSQESYLLYSFFRDRLKAGETWSWEDLSSVIQLIPKGLAELLSDIIVRFNGLIEQTKEKEKSYFANLLQGAILRRKIEWLEAQAKEKQLELKRLEPLGDESAELLTVELQSIFEEKNHLLQVLAKAPGFSS